MRGLLFFCVNKFFNFKKEITFNREYNILYVKFWRGHLLDLY
ncbi:hypothetical protein SAMN05443633_101449 [Chryseobacterium arachidis]|uniref:Uncharacterized protein n=1 Tax=Chryseobacterium arachidis TaxID=1416778 RepID=A0A1M4UAB9_9FLAO|nr:hypothetical protein SAMN05443633_101449 [Chryseobacterium arachidis]